MTFSNFLGKEYSKYDKAQRQKIRVALTFLYADEVAAALKEFTGGNNPKWYVDFIKGAHPAEKQILAELLGEMRARQTDQPIDNLVDLFAYYLEEKAERSRDSAARHGALIEAIATPANDLKVSHKMRGVNESFLSELKQLSASFGIDPKKLLNRIRFLDAAYEVDLRHQADELAQSAEASRN